MHQQRGLSLVELMISITLGLVLMAGVVQMFVSSNTTFGTQQNLSRIQETGRLAMDFIGRDLRMASSYGCVASIDPAKSGATPASKIADPLTYSPGNKADLSGLHYDFRMGLRGYTLPNGSTASLAPLPNSVAVDLGTTFTAKAGSDVLVIRGANEPGLVVTAASPNDDTKVYGFTKGKKVNGCIEGFCANSIAVITDCKTGRFFKLIGEPTLTTNGIATLTHDNWNVATNTDLVFTSGIVFPVHTIVYFVATSATPAGNNIPSLWQKIDSDPTQPAVELLQGVEDMRVTYSTGASENLTGAAYKTADKVDKWEAITSVKVELLVRGESPNSLEEPQTYKFGDETFSKASGKNTTKYIRQVFTSTFAIRSRIQ